MLKSLEIKNFRTFAHLRVQRLGQVNLILGKNNVGKTTLLEALQIYGSPWPAPTAAEVLEFREEIAGGSKLRSLLQIKSLFHGREADSGTTLSVGPITHDNASPTLRIRADIKDYADFDKPQIGDQQAAFPWGPALVAQFDFDPPQPSTSILFPSRRAQYFTEGMKLVDLMVLNPRPLLLRLASAASMLSETADRWDSLALTPGEPQVVNLMQTIAPVYGVRYIDVTDHGRTAIVLIEKDGKPVPLIALGEGVVHLFQIAVALVNSAMAWKSVAHHEQFANMFPCLLIDEFEVGIHHTLHADIWRFVLAAARELGVQVFATTHSWDCLRGFAKATQEVPECDALAIRLEKVEGKERTGAIIIDREDLPIVVRNSIEVR